MLPRRQFRHHATIWLVRGDLRRHHVREHMLAIAHHSGGRFVARTFNPQNVTLRHISNIIGFATSLLPLALLTETKGEAGHAPSPPLGEQKGLTFEQRGLWRCGAQATEIIDESLFSKS